MDEKREKQNRKVTLFAIILSAISLGVLVFGFSVVSSDKVVMLQSISNLYNKASVLFEDDLVLFDKIASNDKVGISAKNTLTIDQDKYNLNFNYLENADDKLSTLNISMLHDEDSLTTNFVFDKENRYFSIKDITPGYYHYQEDNYTYNNIFRSLSSNDYDKVLSLLKEVIDNRIDNGKIKKEKVVIKYDGKDKKVNKLTYEVDYKELKAIMTSFIANVLKDKDLHKNISAVLKGDNSLKNYLENYLEKYKDLEGNILIYSTYYYGFNQIVQYDIHSYIDNLNITYKEDKAKENLNITKDDNTILNVDIDTTNKNKTYTFNGNLSYFIEKSEFKDKEISKLFSNDFSGTYKDKTLDIVFSKEVPLKISFSFTNGVLDGVFKYNANLQAFNIVDKKEEELFNLISEIEFVFDKKIDVDITNSTIITADSLEENQFKELLNANPIYQEIMSKIN